MTDNPTPTEADMKAAEELQQKILRVHSHDAPGFKMIIALKFAKSRMEEREACAVIADNEETCCQDIAQQIRNRGKQP